MKDDNKNQWEVWLVAIVVSIAVLAGLAYKGLTGETIADGVKDIGAAIIPILSAFVAARLVTRQMDPAERFLRAGEAALSKLQAKHQDWLSGPKPDKEDYDEKNPGKADRYLFVQRGGKKLRAQLVRISPLRQGIVEIRVSKRTLQILDVKEGLEQAQKDMREKVKGAVVATLDRDWKKTPYEILDHKDQDIAIVVDFDESKLRPKQFGQAVVACAETAAKKLLEDKK